MRTFELNDIVDVTGRDDLTHHGRIMEFRDAGKALIRFRITRLPRVRSLCDSCGFSGLLSEDVRTGEIVCMRSGCGHKHGFTEWDEVLPLNTLVNISAEREEGVAHG